MFFSEGMGISRHGGRARAAGLFEVQAALYGIFHALVAFLQRIGAGNAVFYGGSGGFPGRRGWRALDVPLGHIRGLQLGVHQHHADGQCQQPQLACAPPCVGAARHRCSHQQVEQHHQAHLAWPTLTMGMVLPRVVVGSCPFHFSIQARSFSSLRSSSTRASTDAASVACARASVSAFSFSMARCRRASRSSRSRRAAETWVGDSSCWMASRRSAAASWALVMMSGYFRLVMPTWRTANGVRASIAFPRRAPRSALIFSLLEAIWLMLYCLRYSRTSAWMIWLAYVRYTCSLAITAI